jgi:DNA-binding MarR family transcriptional regulator
MQITKVKNTVTNEVVKGIEAIQPDWIQLERDLSTIKNVTRIMILDVLQEFRASLSFEDIARKTNINESNLAYHVAQLKKYGFITNEMKNERDGKRFSYYSITDKGKKYMNFIHEQVK